LEFNEVIIGIQTVTFLIDAIGIRVAVTSLTPSGQLLIDSKWTIVKERVSQVAQLSRGGGQVGRVTIQV